MQQKVQWQTSRNSEFRAVTVLYHVVNEGFRMRAARISIFLLKKENIFPLAKLKEYNRVSWNSVLQVSVNQAANRFFFFNDDCPRQTSLVVAQHFCPTRWMSGVGLVQGPDWALRHPCLAQQDKIRPLQAGLGPRTPHCPRPAWLIMFEPPHARSGPWCPTLPCSAQGHVM